MTLVKADACFGKRNLDAYQLFTVVGISSDFNVVPMAYIYISGNESEETWTRARGFAREEFPDLGRLTTVVSDGNRGIVAGLCNIFTVSTQPFHGACAHHRAVNLCKHGKECSKMFHKLLRAPTVASLDNISSSVVFSSLSTAAQAALRRLPDAYQYPAAAVTLGATLYGKEASQGVESNNAAMIPARCYDPLLSIIWQGSRDSRRFHEISQNAHAQDHYPPPRVKARLPTVSPTGEVQPVQASFTITHQAFNVVCEGNVVYRVHLRIPMEGHADTSRWRSGQVSMHVRRPKHRSHAVRAHACSRIQYEDFVNISGTSRTNYGALARTVSS